MYIKDFDICFTKQRIQIKNTFNGVQFVRLEKGTTDFKNYFKQIPVSYKINADFECNITSAESYEGSCS